MQHFLQALELRKDNIYNSLNTSAWYSLEISGSILFLAVYTFNNLLSYVAEVFFSPAKQLAVSTTII